MHMGGHIHSYKSSLASSTTTTATTAAATAASAVFNVAAPAHRVVLVRTPHQFLRAIVGRRSHGEKRRSARRHLTPRTLTRELRHGVTQRQQIQHLAETVASEIAVEASDDDLLSMDIRRRHAKRHEVGDKLRFVDGDDVHSRPLLLAEHAAQVAEIRDRGALAGGAVVRDDLVDGVSAVRAGLDECHGAPIRLFKRHTCE
mmetsp:Transcript_12434/g.30024  ORF Transcript_12434/g.30024 Transcript_12434/m.30024 type:complete len:201 (+) Transcript_12434:146-748(+)